MLDIKIENLLAFTSFSRKSLRERELQLGSKFLRPTTPRHQKYSKSLERSMRNPFPLIKIPSPPITNRKIMNYNNLKTSFNTHNNNPFQTITNQNSDYYSQLTEENPRKKRNKIKSLFYTQESKTQELSILNMTESSQASKMSNLTKYSCFINPNNNDSQSPIINSKESTRVQVPRLSLEPPTHSSRNSMESSNSFRFTQKQVISFKPEIKREMTEYNEVKKTENIINKTQNINIKELSSILKSNLKKNNIVLTKNNKLKFKVTFSDITKQPKQNKEQKEEKKEKKGKGILKLPKIENNARSRKEKYEMKMKEIETTYIKFIIKNVQDKMKIRNLKGVPNAYESKEKTLTHYYYNIFLPSQKKEKAKFEMFSIELFSSLNNKGTFNLISLCEQKYIVNQYCVSFDDILFTLMKNEDIEPHDENFKNEFYTKLNRQRKKGIANLKSKMNNEKFINQIVSRDYADNIIVQKIKEDEHKSKKKKKVKRSGSISFGYLSSSKSKFKPNLLIRWGRTFSKFAPFKTMSVIKDGIVMRKNTMFKRKKVDKKKIGDYVWKLVAREIIDMNRLDFYQLFRRNASYIEIDKQDDEGNTLLILATKWNLYDICEFLIKKGANLDIQDEIGNTAFHYAMRNKNYQISDLLLKYHCNECILNYQGYSPWEYIY